MSMYSFGFLLLIVNKLLHLPTVRLKEAAAAADGVVYADVVRHLFGLGEEERRRDPTPSSQAARSLCRRRPPSSASAAWGAVVR